ncbi:MAG: VWA domain-containing protein [Chloroflexi bacterium]|nr:VWA domain-containing protein [Chloroflexota bacterium]
MGDALSATPTDVATPVGPVFQPRRLATPLDRLVRSLPGKRSYTRTRRKRGRYIASRPANGQPTDVAFDATLRQAALRGVGASEPAPAAGPALTIRPQDVQNKVRVRRAANLILFVVDASWSMAAAARIVATKGAVLSLLQDAYQRRDQVGLVVFQKDAARVVLPPTTSVELAQAALQDVPVGGKTPLSAGLYAAHQIVHQARRRNPEVMPLVVILTDAAGNVSMTGLPPQEEALQIAQAIRRTGIRSVVINTEHESFDRGLAQELAEALGAPCYTIRQLEAQDLVRFCKTAQAPAGAL